MTILALILLSWLPAVAHCETGAVTYCSQPNLPHRDEIEILSIDTTETTSVQIPKGYLTIKIVKIRSRIIRHYETACPMEKEQIGGIIERFQVDLKGNRLPGNMMADSEHLFKNKVVVREHGLYWGESGEPLSIKEVVTEVLMASHQARNLSSLTQRHRDLVFSAATEMANSLR